MIPLSLYIHFPWCVKKCPYCDFNSHTLKEPLPEDAYVEALLLNLTQTLSWSHSRSIISIFMGGGTPSLFSAGAIDKLLQGIRKILPWQKNIEITLEANPGTVEQQRFKEYREIGINRLSLGIQSFNDRHLTALGRIHDAQNAFDAVNTVKRVGFTNFNLDLMFGLPDQTMNEALQDLTHAIDLQPMHLSWYELTIEPNTAFWHKPPALPANDWLADLQLQGQALLAQHGFKQYEVSAYTRGHPCYHNVNYWEFGDYLAIGAGSHGKITTGEQQIMRYHHFRHPKQYMDISQGFIQEKQLVAPDQLAFEYLLNALRLTDGVPLSAFAQRTGLSLDTLMPQLQVAQQKGWCETGSDQIKATPLGYLFLNDVVSLFLPA
jgi:oxygen-independent coproporphyrinogen-3 oxidase